MTILSLEIIETEENEKAIEILYNGYRIIQETIYNNELATKIIELVNSNRQTNPNKTL